MLSIGGATSVAKEHEFVAVFKCRDDDIDDLHEPIDIVTQEGLLDANALIEGFDDVVFHALFS
jgi:hypothetical protein